MSLLERIAGLFPKQKARYEIALLDKGRINAEARALGRLMDSVPEMHRSAQVIGQVHGDGAALFVVYAPPFDQVDLVQARIRAENVMHMLGQMDGIGVSMVGATYPSGIGDYAVYLCDESANES